jgi:hypothetical protein
MLGTPTLASGHGGRTIAKNGAIRCIDDKADERERVEIEETK